MEDILFSEDEIKLSEDNLKILAQFHNMIEMNMNRLFSMKRVYERMLIKTIEEGDNKYYIKIRMYSVRSEPELTYTFIDNNDMEIVSLDNLYKDKDSLHKDLETIYNHFK